MSQKFFRTTADRMLSATLVFSGTLASSGSFGATTAISCSNQERVTALISYTTGSATGSMWFYGQWSADNGQNWFDDTIEDGTITTTSSSTSDAGAKTSVHRSIKKFSSRNGSWRYVFNADGATLFRLQVAESGSVATPGVCVVSMSLKK